MRHWLLKSEPSEFAFEDLKRRPRRTESWSGVRNYQARNFMREMAVGDFGVFYHSSCPVPGAAGVVRIVRNAYPDPTAWDPASPYHDPKSLPTQPRWDQVDVAWHADFKSFVTLTAMQSEPSLRDLLILRRGNRLSVTPLSAGEFSGILALGGITST